MFPKNDTLINNTSIVEITSAALKSIPVNIQNVGI